MYVAHCHVCTDIRVLGSRKCSHHYGSDLAFRLVGNRLETSPIYLGRAFLFLFNLSIAISGHQTVHFWTAVFSSFVRASKLPFSGGVPSYLLNFRVRSSFSGLRRRRQAVVGLADRQLSDC